MRGSQTMSTSVLLHRVDQLCQSRSTRSRKDQPQLDKRAVLQYRLAHILILLSVSCSAMEECVIPSKMVPKMNGSVD